MHNARKLHHTRIVAYTCSVHIYRACMQVNIYRHKYACTISVNALVYGYTHTHVLGHIYAHRIHSNILKKTFLCTHIRIHICTPVNTQHIQIPAYTRTHRVYTILITRSQCHHRFKPLKILKGTRTLKFFKNSPLVIFYTYFYL